MISGGIKFFKQNKSLFKNGTTAIASTNTDSAKHILSSNKYAQWESIGSNDITDETITITLSQSVDINRIFLIDHNMKQFTIKYWGGSSWDDFTSVVGIDGSLGSGISETAFSQDTAYYEFDSVNTDQFLITGSTTQTANQDKEIVQFIATEEIGTFLGYPRVQGLKHNNNITKSKLLSNKTWAYKSQETLTFQIDFNSHPYQNDVDILEVLHESIDPFLVWLCGGRYGTSYFRIEQRGWRLKDVYNMQESTAFGSLYSKNIYINGAETGIALLEHI